jgi:hypothetical protein
LRFAVALVVVASRSTEAGTTPQMGGSLAGTGETLQVKLTVPAKPPVPVTVIIEEPDWPETEMLIIAGSAERPIRPEPAGSAAFTAENASRSPKPSMLFGMVPDSPDNGTAVDVRKFRKFARSVAGSAATELAEACKTSAATAAACGAAAEVPAK